MKNRILTSAGILVLLVFIYQYLFSFLLLEIKQGQCRDNFRSIIQEALSDKTAWTHISVPVEWTKGEENPFFEALEDGEFRYMERYYDYDSSSEADGLVTFHCLPDKDEDEIAGMLNRNINLWAASSSPAKSRGNFALYLKMFSSLFLEVRNTGFQFAEANLENGRVSYQYFACSAPARGFLKCPDLPPESAVI